MGGWLPHLVCQREIWLVDLQATDHRVDNDQVNADEVTRCTAVGWWKGYTVSFTAIALGGGFLMLVAAAIAHRTASIPLLIIGAWWCACGLIAVRQYRRVAREAQLSGDVLTFVFANRSQSIPVGEIDEIRRARGDISHWMPIQVRSVGGEVVRLPPRMIGLFDLLMKLRTLNPAIRIADF
jgi:hypothetical protein